MKRDFLKKGGNRKEKKKKGVSGPSLSYALFLTLTLSASWLHVFTNYAGMQREGPILGDLAFIYILTGLCLSCSLFFFFRRESEDGISRGQKETARIIQATKSLSERPTGICMAAVRL